MDKDPNARILARRNGLMIAGTILRAGPTTTVFVARDTGGKYTVRNTDSHQALFTNIDDALAFAEGK